MLFTSQGYLSRVLRAAIAAGIAGSGLAGAQRSKPIPHPIGVLQGPNRSALATGAAKPGSAPWTPLANQPTFLLNGASNPILLTDGSVLIQDAAFPDWWKLTPDQHGSYISGSWTQVASLPPTYSPLYHSSAVLPDGRLIIEGGEYLLNSTQTGLVPSWTNQGAIYDPLANTWTPVTPPAGWQSIGDAQSVVLPNGTYMQANCCSEQQALLDAKTLTWTPTGNNKFDANDEEGWNLLPNGEVLTVDAYVPIDSAYDPAGTNSELYNPKTGSWHTAGSTVEQLWDSAADCGGESAASFEVGPAVLRPDGTVFYTGANRCGPANTAIYNSHSGRWTAGPAFPGDYGIPDGPASIETNGKVLMMADSGRAGQGAGFFEWNGEALTQVAGTPDAPYDRSYFGNMLVLPTGQILLTDFSDDIEIYTPQAAHHPEWAPLILEVDLLLRRGSTFKIGGLRFNGMTQGAAYGDDVQAATNYPLVRMTNLLTGHVFYSRTHDPSSMAVASNHIVTTRFDVPRQQEPGLNILEVVANGIPSPPVLVWVE